MAKRKEKIAAPVKSLRGQERAYQKQLNKLGKALIVAVRKEVLPYLKANQTEYVVDGQESIVVLKYLTDSDYDYLIPKLWEVSKERLFDSALYDGVGFQLGVIFEKLNETFTGPVVKGFAKTTSLQMVEKVSKTNKGKFDRSVQRAIGVDLGNIVTTEGLEDFVELSVNKNVSLINSLPEEYLKQVETIVNNGVISGLRYSEIEKQILGKVGTANSKLANRIKTIAMNEIQTINSQITLRRSDSLGIDEGFFRTSEDEKVRKCHKELNGVRYKLNKGAWSKTCGKWIQPGITDINCRCSYSPIIEIEGIQNAA